MAFFRHQTSVLKAVDAEKPHQVVRLFLLQFEVQKLS